MRTQWAAWLTPNRLAFPMAVGTRNRVASRFTCGNTQQSNIRVKQDQNRCEEVETNSPVTGHNSHIKSNFSISTRNTFCVALSCCAQISLSSALDTIPVLM